jgi:hypothetical protein
MYSNKHFIPLPMAVWLADETYEPHAANVISATSLQKPLRALVLERRLSMEGEIELMDLVPSRLGTAVHSAVETSWKRNYGQALKALGYTEEFIERIRINPQEIQMLGEENLIPVYLEQRKSMEMEGVVISGQFDMVIDGQLYDFKTTQSYTLVSGGNNRDYQLQGSIYRMLNPEIITGWSVKLLFLVTDWSRYRAMAEEGRNGPYPDQRIVEKELPLLSIAETKRYIRERVRKMRDLLDVPQEELPECTPQELWQEPSKWAVYKNPENTGKATRVFDNQQDAYIWNAQSTAGKGMIVERPAVVRRCGYCNARSICEQADSLAAQGLLA